jgi:uncharacterized caspase-like protein
MWKVALDVAKYVAIVVVYDRLVKPRFVRRGKNPVKDHSPNPTQMQVVNRALQKKKAVCIGINYTKTAHELKGCINDARCIKTVLVSQYGFNDSDVKIIADTEGFVYPTSQNIMGAISWLVEGCAPGDVLFFSYSGHGTNIKDTNNDEADGRDEAIYTLDGAVIIDDVLQAQLMQKIPKGVQLVCVFDCCHSGTIADLQYCYKYIPSSTDQFLLTQERTKEISGGGDIVVYSACLDPQTAADSNFNGKWVKTPDGKMSLVWGEGNGAFTWFFLQVLKDNNYVISNDELLKKTATLLLQQKFSQEAQLTTTNTEMFKKQFTL